MISYFSILFSTFFSLSACENYFSAAEIKHAAMLAQASYNPSDFKKKLGKLEKEGWTYSHFDGKNFLGIPYKAGLIAFSPVIAGAKQKIFIAFRGTQTLSDITADITLSQKTHHPFKVPGNIHSGFLHLFKTSISAIKLTISSYAYARAKNLNDFEIITTGHSLGGALATLTGFDLISDTYFGLSENNNTVNPIVRTLTFAAPRVGDYLFSQEYNQLFGIQNHLRFTFPGDLLPNLPLEQWNYKHVGTEVALKDSPPEGPLQSFLNQKFINHSIANYIKHIKLYLKQDFIKDLTLEAPTPG